MSDRSSDRTGEPTVTPKTEGVTPVEPPEVSSIVNARFSIDWNPQLAETEKIPDEHTAMMSVKSGDLNFNDIDLILEKKGDGEKTKREEKKTDKAVRLEAPELFDGEQKAYLEYKTNGETRTTEKQTITKETPNQYIADITLSEDTSPVEHSHSTRNQWSTPYSFDDHVFDQQRINQRREKWNQEAAWDGFTQQLQQDGKVLEAEFGEYPNEEKVEGLGYFDIDEFTSVTKKEGGFRELLEWIQPAVQMRDFYNEVSMASGAANKMAASAEQAIDQLHEDAEARGWGVYNPMLEGGGTHGTMVFYDEKWGTGWWHVDTTSNIIRKPENSQEHREDVWSPFRSKDADLPGFHPGPVRDGIPSNLSYRDKSSTGMFGLAGMVLSGRPEEHNPNKLFITDQWLDEAYGHMREDKSIDPILDPIEEMIHTQIETGEYVGIFGDTLEEAKLIAGPDLEDLYQEVIAHPEPVTQQDIFHHPQNN